MDRQEHAVVEETTVETGWANPPSLTDLKTDLTTATSDFSHQKAKIEEWLDFLNVEGKAKFKADGDGRSEVQPKLIRKQAEWRYASLEEPFLSTNDLFNAEPVTYEDKKGAIQNNLVLNNQFNTKINKVKLINEYVRACVDEGTSILRVGWDFEEEEVSEEQPVYEYVPTNDSQVGAFHDQLLQMQEQDPAAYEQEIAPEFKQAQEIALQTGQPTIPRMVGTETVTRMVTVKNQPTVDMCSYTDVIADPTCGGDIDKAAFVIYRFETSKAELERDGKYSNLDKIQPENGGTLSAEDDAIENNSFKFNDEPRKKIIAYEYWGYWDIHGTGKVEPIVITWVGSTIIRMEENPFPDKKLPFVFVQYLPVRGSLYGEPDGELLQDNQKIIGALTRGMIDIMARSANGQMGVSKEALDLTNQRKFDRGEDYQFNPGTDPGSSFYMHTWPEIPRSAEALLDLQNNEAESLTGVKAFHSGISGQALGSTATGIRSAMDATSKRELGILRRLAEGMKQVGRKIIAMNAVFLDEEEVVRVTNEQFVTVRRDDLAGNFDLRLTISTAESDNEKAEQLAFMMQTMGNTMPMDFSQMVLADYARLRKMPALAKKIEDYEYQPDPLEQELKMLERQKLIAEINKLNSEAAENNAEAQLDLAKAGEAQSKKDLLDLDYVEQESGVKQVRDLEKLGEQARGNIALETVRARLNPKPPAGKATPGA